MQTIKSRRKIHALRIQQCQFHKGATVHYMSPQPTLSSADIGALFGGLKKLLAESNPAFAQSFHNYQTLYNAFAKAQNEITELKQELARIKKSTT